MTIRRALLGGLIALVIVSTVIVTTISIWSLRKNVHREAQARSDTNLRIMASLYEERLEILARNISAEAESLCTESCCSGSALAQIRQAQHLDILNVCDIEGRPMCGGYDDFSRTVPFGHDPVLSRARDGQPSWGTVKLDPDRIAFEGGPSMVDRVAVHHDPDEPPVTQAALFMWVAVPVRNSRGHIAGILYGGRSLNHQSELVDDLRQLLFGNEQFERKPVGTVTVFMDSIRVATNVIGPDNRRAVGTVVSHEVQNHVLGEGQSWHNRAYVVDEWYISGYRPLRDPDGTIIGMFYVGLLEDLYNALETRLLLTILGPVLLVLLAGSALGFLIIRRITLPLRDLSMAAEHLRGGNWHNEIAIAPGFDELNTLSATFSEMQRAIAARDRQLRTQNTELEQTNEKLETTNRNYMKMLGFITHELKSPLAAIQTMTSVVLGGMAGEVPEDVREFLQRIGRSAEELQDMVKNYLDLSRVEQGELAAIMQTIEFRTEVVEPSVTNTAHLFSSRGITLDVDCPEQADINADPELLRIALTNFLTNAAKYGFEGGTARLTVTIDHDTLHVDVWNEGEGFTPDERTQLFRKFTRLRNAATRDKRGSGLGLFLCSQIIDLHDGTVDADAELGHWARFGFTIPA